MFGPVDGKKWKTEERFVRVCRGVAVAAKGYQVVAM